MKKPSYPDIAWGIFAAVAGLGCLVLPVFLTPGATENPTYGTPLIPWFAIAFANLRYLVSMGSSFVLGAFIGAARPRSWFLLAMVTFLLSFILNAINIAHDLRIDSTSHNLLPLEFVMILVAGFPALPGACLASFIRKKLASPPSFPGPR